MSVSIQRKIEKEHKLESHGHFPFSIDKHNSSEVIPKSRKPYNHWDGQNNKSINALHTETVHLNIDFLPKVVHKDEIGNSAAEASISSSTLGINEDELTFLPLVIDDGSTITGNPESGTEVNDPKKALHDGLEWFEIDADTNLGSLLKFISLIPDDQGGLNEPAQEQHESLNISSRLSNPILFDGKTFISRRLLEDIEAFGDCREIPLLKELQLKSKNEDIINRIEGIMLEFKIREAKTSQRNIRNYLEEEFNPFSVFEDLFRNCDVEAKLILMDMILDVGDKKELNFLKKLCKDPNAEIRTKAITVLQGLENKIFKESLCFDLSDTFDILSQERTTNQQELFKAWLEQNSSILDVIKRSIR
ncbi:hypothetical protein HPE56_00610 [Maribacter sp. ANRC-HE7]|uniref:HEAT repeat-containing protein n=1 Tax=Maribacter aquimaris TaxID=2737171 RepID=A0ABR7UV86_9FLAO|nr:hypothetical protein [Maribacter aquimaris]MBD0776280.1 hypothetical protein [Maribacter aquimaris]